MSSAFIYYLLTTVYKTKELKLDETNLEIKPRSVWKQKAFNNLLICFVSIAVFIFLSKVPYAGPVFFLAGLIGALYSITFLVRALLIYKYYDDVFSEENIKKLIGE